MVTSKKILEKRKDKISRARKCCKLEILAQPEKLHRLRYQSERKINSQQIARRFHPAEKKSGWKYPAISIPDKLNDGTDTNYIHVALATVGNEYVSERCTHPYPFYTDGNHPEELQDDDGYFFKINENDLKNGFKEFRLEITKLLYTDEQTLRTLPVFGPANESRLANLTSDCKNKTMFEVYDLDSAQFIFSCAKRLPDGSFQVLYDSSISSQIITHKSAQKTIQVSDKKHCIVCNPASCRWEGGENIKIVFQEYDAEKFTVFSVSFQFPQPYGTEDVPYRILADRSLIITAPKCPIITNDSSLVIPIILKANEAVIGTFDFHYEKRLLGLPSDHGSLTSNIDILCTHAVNMSSEINNLITADALNEQYAISTMASSSTNAELSTDDIDALFTEYFGAAPESDGAMNTSASHAEFATPKQRSAVFTAGLATHTNTGNQLCQWQ